MDRSWKWVPAFVPPDEGYWEALLRDEQEAHLVGDVISQPVTLPAAEADERPSLGPAPSCDAWDEARDAMDCGTVLELPVVGCNRGGLLVAWNGLRGFVPASHLLRDFSPTVDEEERHEELRTLVGTRLNLKVLELDRDEGRFVLSERATRVDEDRRQEALAALSPGDVCRGRVTNLCTFGAFVDLDGVEGLVHISELSWGRVDHPSNVLHSGQGVDVYVLNVDRERGRVGLSIKRLQPDPWASAQERYHVGEVIDGVVTRVVPFGAFVRVQEGLEGLLHISELGGAYAPEEPWPFSEGERISVRVLNVDGRQRRMALSLLNRQRPVQDGSSWSAPLERSLPGGGLQ